mgnify:CR=1 FL=1
MRESRPGEKTRQLTPTQCVFPLLLRAALDASEVMVHRENRSVTMQMTRSKNDRVLGTREGADSLPDCVTSAIHTSVGIHVPIKKFAR